MSREENNRKLAEWLGWKLVEVPYWDALVWRDPESGLCWASPPDFYASEEASAMLVDKMGEFNSEITFSFWSESSLHVVKHGHLVSCFVNVCRNKKRVEFRADAPNRKTAIANVALKLIEREGV